MSRNEDSDHIENLIEEYTARRISRRAFFQRSAAFGITLGAAGALLAACGGGGSDSADTAADTSGGGETTAAADTGAAAEPVKGGTLIEGYDRDFAVLDPVFTTWDDPAFVALYEFPLVRDADGAYQPALFDSWTVSDDLLTWTFTLPAGRVFHSGAAVDAQMVAENFNAFRSDGTEKPKNTDGPGQNSIFWPTVENATASDPTTVVVTMKAPFTAFPETLATENSVIVNLVTRRELGVAPDGTYGTAGADGTGPFTFSSYQPGTEVVVNRWDEYPGTNIPYVTNPGPAYLDSVKWVPILEAGQRANEIEGGTVNVVKNPAPQDTERLQANSDLVVTSFPSLSNYFLGLNHGQTQLGFDDVNVRQAISMAIDRQALVDSIFFGQAVATYGPIASNYKWYDSGVEQFNQFDPEQAKSLLDGAGWTEGAGGIREKGGQKLSFTVTSNDLYQPTTAAIDQAIVPMLADVGVEMKLNVPDAAEYFGIVAAAGAPEKADTVDAWTFEWLWSSPVDLLIYFQAFPSKAFNGDLPDIAAAVEQWQTAPDIETLEAAARAFQLAWAEQLPEIPILTRNDVWVAQKNVMGYAPFQSMLYPLYNDVYISS